MVVSKRSLACLLTYSGSSSVNSKTKHIAHNRDIKNSRLKAHHLGRVFQMNFLQSPTAPRHALMAVSTHQILNTPNFAFE